MKNRPKGSPPVISYHESSCPNEKLEGPCHIYSRYKDKNGYGWTSLNGKKYSVHRYVWEVAHGPIQEGLEIDHMCRNTSCCNVLHLRAVTHRTNTIENSDSIAAVHLRRNTCKWGHEWTPENTRIRARVGGRDCRACARIRFAKMAERGWKRKPDKKASK